MGKILRAFLLAVMVAGFAPSCSSESGICSVAADFGDIDPTEDERLQELLDAVDEDPPEIAEDLDYLREANELLASDDSLEVNFDDFYAALDNVAAYGEENC